MPQRTPSKGTLPTNQQQQREAIMIQRFRGVKPLFPAMYAGLSQTVESFVASFWTVLLTLYSLILIVGTVIVALFGWTVIIGGPL